jgi:hypothetical protein
VTAASACAACLGESHDNCTGTEGKPCACGCLPSASSLHRYSLSALQTHNQPMHTAVTRRIASMRHDGKQVD